MYVVTIHTTKGTFREEIDEMTLIDQALAPYEKDYIGFEAQYKEGRAKPRENKENIKMEKPKVTITDYDIN